MTFIESLNDSGQEHWGLLLIVLTLCVVMMAIDSLIVVVRTTVLAYRRLRLVHSRNYKMLKAAATGTHYNMRRSSELFPGIPAWLSNTPRGATDIQSAGSRD